MNFVGWLIVASEVGFWMAIVLGLIIRYFFRLPKLGLFFLSLSPLIDFILLIATGYDLLNGTTATTAHGIAAVYIGVSIAYGKNMIAWADQKYQYYIMKQGQKPKKKYGIAYAKDQLFSSLRHLLAFSIGSAFLFILILVINNAARTDALTKMIMFWALITGIDLLYSFSYFIWPKKPKANSSISK